MADRLSAITVTFSAKAFALTVVKKAAYRILDRGVAEITSSGDEITCVIHFHSPKDVDEAREIERQLRAEVLDQDLRGLIAEETAPVRNAVLAYAFSRTGLQDKNE